MAKAPKDVKGGASDAKKVMKKGPKVETKEPSPKAKEKADLADERKWKAESALDTLTRAEEHKQDKALMRDVESVRSDKMRALANVKCETAPKLPR